VSRDPSGGSSPRIVTMVAWPSCRSGSWVARTGTSPGCSTRQCPCSRELLRSTPQSAASRLARKSTLLVSCARHKPLHDSGCVPSPEEVMNRCDAVGERPAREVARGGPCTLGQRASRGTDPCCPCRSRRRSAVRSRMYAAAVRGHSNRSHEPNGNRRQVRDPRCRRGGASLVAPQGVMRVGRFFGSRSEGQPACGLCARSASPPRSVSLRLESFVAQSEWR